MSDEKELNTYQVEKILDDHEQRLRRLEESDIRQQVMLSEIQKSQSDIKVLMMQTNKEQNDTFKEQNNTLKEFMTTMLESTTSTINNTLKANNEIKMSELETKNTIKLTDRKELWGLVAAIITLIITYLLKLK